MVVFLSVYRSQAGIMRVESGFYIFVFYTKYKIPMNQDTL